MSFDLLQRVLDANSLRIVNLGTPTSGTDATRVTTTLSDIKAPGAVGSLGSLFVAAPADHVHPLGTLEFKSSVRAATTANVTLSGTQTVDGVSLIAGDRVLVKNQTTGSENGAYSVASGAWTRTVDFDANAEVVSAAVFNIQEGTIQGTSTWMLSTPNPINIGTTTLTFALTGPQPGAAMPLAAGTAQVGTAIKFAREDHGHAVNGLFSALSLTADLTVPAGFVYHQHNLSIVNGVTLTIADGAEMLLL